PERRLTTPHSRTGPRTSLLDLLLLSPAFGPVAGRPSPARDLPCPAWLHRRTIELHTAQSELSPTGHPDEIRSRSNLSIPAVRGRLLSGAHILQIRHRQNRHNDRSNREQQEDAARGCVETQDRRCVRNRQRPAQ